VQHADAKQQQCYVSNGIATIDTLQGDAHIPTALLELLSSRCCTEPQLHDLVDLRPVRT
jgi:hypothetical protein